MRKILLLGGHVVDGTGAPPRPADVTIDNGVIVAVGDAEDVKGADTIDCTGRLVVPGFIDAHSHADGAVFRTDVQLALLRQGITTVVAGQDGVSYAPGDGRFGSRYFAAINGPHPSYTGGGVGSLLTSYDGTTPVNVAYLVPAGTVRHEIMGAQVGAAHPHEVNAMVSLVETGMAEGAVGISSGLDYVPGLFADASEIAALCRPAAAVGVPYVTHMRGGYEDNSRAGILEVAAIAKQAGIRVHISHFHCAPPIAYSLMDLLAGEGIEASFDAYPYTRGCSLLSMMLLPPEMNMMATEEVVEQLQDPHVRQGLRRSWFPSVAHNPSLGPEWPDMITIGHTASKEFSWAHAGTIARIAQTRRTDAIDAALDLLEASHLEVNVIMAVRHQRSVADLGRLIAHPNHVGGSDAIYIGSHPHPRAYGTFASYLGTYTRAHAFLDWAGAVDHLSTKSADLYQLGARGRIQPHAIADIAIVNPEEVRDHATYEEPTRMATGIADVLVAGVPVLAEGQLTGLNAGRGVRRESPGGARRAQDL